jgi:ribosomal protein L11 methylase PrmA
LTRRTDHLHLFRIAAINLGEPSAARIDADPFAVAAAESAIRRFRLQLSRKRRARDCAPWALALQRTTPQGRRG